MSNLLMRGILVAMLSFTTFNTNGGVDSNVSLSPMKMTRFETMIEGNTLKINANMDNGALSKDYIVNHIKSEIDAESYDKVIVNFNVSSDNWFSNKTLLREEIQ